MSTFPERTLGRYRLLSLLGAGGMGEVYRALDTELGREVAVKVLPPDFAEDPERVRWFEIEARAAAAISHPNILAIFDVGRSDGTSYLVTELLEGETLRERIRSDGLTVATAVGYAIQAAHGLAAAHAKGVLHRDLKTENLFLTTDGQVKILDFGLAKLAPTEEVLDESAETATGAALGTVGYMAPGGGPGPARGRAVGPVLARCSAVRDGERAQAVSGREPGRDRGPRPQRDPSPMPPEVPTPAQRIVLALPGEAARGSLSVGARPRTGPRGSARAAGAGGNTVWRLGEPRPYPGLASFTEADAAYFFGREAEVEELWRRIPGRRLLAVIGPSGAGKSSFLRAGVLPAAPGGWSTLVCQPGEAPFASLARALVPVFAGDTEATGQLFRLREPEVAVEVVRKWRRRRDEALLVVDQLEELFTLNPPAIQASFSALLGQLADEADVHIVLAMRDDFLIHCHEHEALAPVFSELTPLLPPTGDALRRAVVEPARKHGFAFEDDGLVGEMLTAVEGERGALPMLAFALARLWEQRDPQRKLITREAYERIGGVGGALAQHAEAALTRIGDERLPIVRELFRNLVTAQGTRAVREVQELLSVFDREVRSPSSRASEARQPSSRANDAPLPSSRASEASRGISRSQVDGHVTASSESGGDPSTRSLRSLAQDDSLPSSRASEAPLPSSRASKAPFPSSRASEASRGIPRSQVDGHVTASPESGGDPSTRSLRSLAQDDRRGAAEEVLRELVDARLLTSYEIHGEGEQPTRRVEIIHESLLANWPRLVGWQTQDADSARLRDELRQAARTWEEHDRTDDLLWTGSTYREFAVWRERYPGGLSEIEEAYAHAMTSSATRRRRRRRIAVAAVLVIAVGVTTVTTALWRRSVLQERRAEAQKLIALGQVRLEDYPTATLAYATRSLELADSEEARLLALEALWEGPTAFIVNETPSLTASFSPGGNWLVQTHDFTSSLAVISRSGLQRVMDHPTESGTTRVGAAFGGAEDIFVSAGSSSDAGRIALWSAPEGRLLASARPLGDTGSVGGYAVSGADTERPRGVFAVGTGDLVTVDALHIDGSHEKLGELRLTVPAGQGGDYCLDPASGDWLAVVDRNEVSVLRVGERGLTDRRLLGRHEGDVLGCMADPLGRFFLTITRSGEIRRWDPSGELAPTDFELPPGFRPFYLSANGSYLVAGTDQREKMTDWWIGSLGDSGLSLVRRLNDVKTAGGWYALDSVGPRLVMRGPSPAYRLWSLAAPAGAEPIVLRRGPSQYSHVPSFSPDGRWLATNDRSGLAIWPLVRPYPAVIAVDFEAWSYGVAFTPGGQSLVTSAGSEVRAWPLVGPIPPAGHVVFEAGRTSLAVAVSPNGELFAVGNGVRGPQMWIGKDGEEPLQLAGAEELKMGTEAISFSSDGRYVAALDGGYDWALGAFHVWEVATGEEVAVLRLPGEEFRGTGSSFASDGRLLTGSTKGVVAWDLGTGEHEVLAKVRVQDGVVSSEDGRRFLVTEDGDGDGYGGSGRQPHLLRPRHWRRHSSHHTRVARAENGH